MMTPATSAPVSDRDASVRDAICVSHLSVRYQRAIALQDIDCTIEPGCLTGIIGPNGAGKSTLLKAILGLTPVVSGGALYHGKPLAKQLEKVAYVPQRSQIDWTFPATVWDVALMGRTRKTGWLRRVSPASRHIVRQALARLGMEAYGDRRIGDLSGGQQQRVFIARALAQEAEVFLFDEPFAGIDRKTETLLFDTFQDLAREGKIVAVVNHDLGESVTHFDRLILLNREVVAAGPRDRVLQVDAMTRAYGGRVQFFAA